MREDVTYSIAEIIYGLFAVILAVGFVAIMSVSAVKYYINKNNQLDHTAEILKLIDNATVSINDDTISITLHGHTSTHIVPHD